MKYWYMLHIIMLSETNQLQNIYDSIKMKYPE